MLGRVEDPTGRRCGRMLTLALDTPQRRVNSLTRTPAQRMKRRIRGSGPKWREMRWVLVTAIDELRERTNGDCCKCA